ncbi:hypothetical protein JCM8097_009037 [Rhodosporidiobolus ruineniae]
MSTTNRQSRSRASSLSGRPTTPLRRLSSSSLRAASLSHSLSSSTRGGDHSAAQGALGHLEQYFAELANAVQDLTANVEQLSLVQRRLDGFNEAMGAYLFGLRANGYTADFLEAPAKLNFDLASERAESRFKAEQGARLAHLELQHQHQQSSLHSPPRSPSSSAQAGAETTFVTNDEESFVMEHETPRAGSAAGRGGARGRGGIPAAAARGRGRGGKVAPGAGAPVGRRKKEEMAAFADPLLPLLPISLRENRRQECERVLWVLKERPGGVAMADLVTSLSLPASQAVPQVRINEVLLALVRAKIAVKALVKGVAQYRLDPSKVAT